MPRYFFTSIDSARFPDAEGTEFPDLHAAKCEAATFLGTIIRDRPELASDSRYYGVEVTDESKRVLFTAITLIVDGAASLPLDHDPQLVRS